MHGVTMKIKILFDHHPFQMKPSRHFIMKQVKFTAFLQENQPDARISQIYFSTKTTCFGQFLCQSSGIFHCTHSYGICADSLLAGSGRNVLILLARRGVLIVRVTQFLDAFAQLGNASISLVIPACPCPSVYPAPWNNNWDPTGRNFTKFHIRVFLRKYVEKIQVSLKCERIKGLMCG